MDNDKINYIIPWSDFWLHKIEFVCFNYILLYIIILFSLEYSIADLSETNDYPISYEFIFCSVRQLSNIIKYNILIRVVNFLSKNM